MDWNKLERQKCRMCGGQIPPHSIHVPDGDQPQCKVVAAPPTLSLPGGWSLRKCTEWRGGWLIFTPDGVGLDDGFSLEGAEKFAKAMNHSKSELAFTPAFLWERAEWYSKDFERMVKTLGEGQREHAIRDLCHSVMMDCLANFKRVNQS